MKRRAVFVSLFAALALVPFLYWERTFSYIAVKSVVLSLGIGIALICLAAFPRTSGQHTSEMKTWVLPLALWGWCVFVCLHSSGWELTEGLFYCMCAGGCVWLGCVFAEQPAPWDRLWQAVSIWGAIAATVVILKIDNGFGYPWGNKNLAAAFVIFPLIGTSCYLMQSVLAKKYARLIPQGLAIVLMLGGLARCGSAGAWLGLVAGLLAGAWMIFEKHRKTVILLTVLMLVSGAALLFGPWQERWFGPKGGSTLGIRMHLWKASWRLFLEHPNGVGPGMLYQYLPAYFDFDYRAHRLANKVNFSNFAHAWPLQMLAATGIAGLVLALGWVVQCVRKLKMQNDLGDRRIALFFAVTCGMAVHGCTSVSLSYAAVAAYFWFSAGVLTGLTATPVKTQDQDEVDKPQRIGCWLTMACGLVVLILGMRQFAAEWQVKKGRDALVDNQYDKALVAWERADRLALGGPLQDRAQHDRAVVLYADPDRREEALGVFETLETRSPLSNDLPKTMAKILLNQGSLEQGLDRLYRQLFINPYDLEAYGLALGYAMTGERPDMLGRFHEILGRASRVDSQNKAGLVQMLNQYDQACAQETILETQSNNNP